MFTRAHLVGIAAVVAGCTSATDVAPATHPAAVMRPPSTTTRPVADNPPARPRRFLGTVRRLSPAVSERMTSWHPGCPVSLDDLRLVSVTYWGFDRKAHQGRLIANKDASRTLVTVMARLFAARFPIRRMRLVDSYGSDDDRSMAANNTSAFNCRQVAGGGTWSEHAYGRAIDINPIQNPEVRDGVVSPSAGALYLDRTRAATGMVNAGGVVVRTFALAGWGWGGAWQTLSDYQHFSASGR
jgi:hypothetical protein